MFQDIQQVKGRRGQAEGREDRNRYDEAKRAARREIARAKEVERREFGKTLDEADERKTIFRVAKQNVKNNRDVVGGRCIRHNW